MRLSSRIALVIAGGILAVWRVGYATDLSYSLTSPLKPATAGQCGATDRDDDCLDDNMEAMLANIVSPYYLWDESEGCNWYSTRDSDAAHGATAGQSHDQPRFYYQVRPILQGYPNISGWYPNDGWYHWVRVKFFLNYPRDCAAPHQGDNEMVYYDLYSLDLTNWAIGTGYTARHLDSPDPQATGAFLYNLAHAAGVSYPVQLADQNGHGSWFGSSATSDWCSDTSQGNLFVNHYCTTGTSITNAIQLGNYVFPGTDKNIGEPVISGSNGRWNSSTLVVSGSDAYSVEVTGDYVVNGVPQGLREYWNNKANTSWQKFCGWQCAGRVASGDCATNIHGNGTDCTTAMWSKVSQSPFTK